MDSDNIFATDYSNALDLRSKIKGQKPLVLWMTGLSGSGKSTIARALEIKLLEAKFHTFVLDGDNVREGLNKGLGFSQEDRKENLRRIGEVSKLFIEAGVIVIATFVSPLRDQRKMVKSIVGASFFKEVYINTPLEECERRDVKGLYKKARAGEIKNFTGIGSIYEEPLKPDFEVQTKDLSINESVDQLINDIIPLISNG